MGLLGKIFGDSDLGCATGVAISPLYAFASGECEETIGKVADKVREQISDSPGPDDYRDEAKTLLEGLMAPVPFYTLGRFAVEKLTEKLDLTGLSPEAGAELRHRVESMGNLFFLGVAPLVFPGAVYPIAVGLERYARPLVPQVSTEELGSLVGDFVSAAVGFGLAGAGAKALAAGVKKAQSAVDPK